MKISPEPLHPLGSWRELWYVKTPVSTHSSPQHAGFRTRDQKQQKRPAFHWIGHLVNRNHPE